MKIYSNIEEINTNKGEQNMMKKGESVMNDWKQKSFKVSEIAEILKCSEQVVRREIKAGNMKAFRVGKSFRVSAVQLNEYMADTLEMEVKQ
jgi:excisionase family DNA binding protein